MVTMATKVITAGGDIGLQGHSAWLLGRLYLSSCSLTDGKSAGKIVGVDFGCCVKRLPSRKHAYIILTPLNTTFI